MTVSIGVRGYHFVRAYRNIRQLLRERVANDHNGRCIELHCLAHSRGTALAPTKERISEHILHRLVRSVNALF